MKTWLMEPRDSVLLRDGRPAVGGAAMRSLPFALPATTSGFVRAQVGTNPKTGAFELSAEQARAIAVRGPVLVELRQDAAPELLLPAPVDTVLFEVKADPTRAERFRLTPAPTPAAAATDLHADLELLDFVGCTSPPRAKPVHGPRFWRWSELRPWLFTPPSAPDSVSLELGVSDLLAERRTHVSIDAETWTAAEGMLFSTEMLRFAERKPVHLATADESNPPCGRATWRTFALAVGCDDTRLRPGLGHLGGERRLCRLGAVEGDSLWPSLPPGTFAAGARRVRVLLLTPGIFAAGYKPADRPDARLVAAAVGRPEVISGWDLAEGGPKATRRMVSAGSVYWYELAEGVDAQAWAEQLWLRSVADDPQDQRDGFGLCVVGVV